jgi:hypothetical protein
MEGVTAEEVTTEQACANGGIPCQNPGKDVGNPLLPADARNHAA